MNVDANLYEFLKENETGMYLHKNELVVYVHVHFGKLTEFVEIVGRSPFDEDGLEVRMFEYTLAIELNDIIENNDQEILAYRNCFDASDIEDYMPHLTARLAT